MNYEVYSFLALYRRLMNVSNGGRGSQETQLVSAGKFLLVFALSRCRNDFSCFLYVLVLEEVNKADYQAVVHMTPCLHHPEYIVCVVLL